MLYIKLALCAGIFAACIVLPARAARTYGESAHTLRGNRAIHAFFKKRSYPAQASKGTAGGDELPVGACGQIPKSVCGKHGKRAGGKAGKADEGRGARLELTGKYEQAVLQELEYAARALENGDAEIASEQLEAAYERLTELAEEADRCFEKKRELYRRTGLISAAAVCMLII